MKQYVAALACAAAMYAGAQTNPIPAPADWRAESFVFPLQFAASIPYQGVEYVRFAPSWTRFDSEGGFSYVFLWDVKTQPVTPEDLEDYLEVYFAGLMRNVGLQRKLSDKEIRERIDSAIARLSEEHRAVIILREIDGLEYQEIADTVIIAVEERLHVQLIDDRVLVP